MDKSNVDKLGIHIHLTHWTLNVKNKPNIPVMLCYTLYNTSCALKVQVKRLKTCQFPYSTTYVTPKLDSLEHL